jgi:hypothetical protein
MKGGCRLERVVGLLLAQVEGIDLVGAREGAAHAPLHALGRDAFVDAQALEDLQRFLRVADAARGGALDAHGVVLVQQHGLHAVAGERAGQRQPRDAAAHDGNGVAFRFTGAQLRRFHKRVFGQGVTRALGEFIAVGEGGVCLRHGCVLRLCLPIRNQFTIT